MKNLCLVLFTSFFVIFIFRLVSADVAGENVQGPPPTPSSAQRRSKLSQNYKRVRNFPSSSSAASSITLATVEFGSEKNFDEIELLHRQKLPSSSSSSSSHDWFELPPTISFLNSSSTKKEEEVVNVNDEFLSSKTPQQLVELGLASTDGLVTPTSVTHIDVPLYAVFFVDQKKIFLHLFKHPNFLRLHEGHHHPPKNQKQKSSEKESSFSDKHHLLKRESERFWVPSEVEKLVFLLTSSSSSSSRVTVKALELSSRELMTRPRTPNEIRQERQRRKINSREGKQQASSATTKQPELISLSVVGDPKTQINIVFLSAGYRAQDREMFIKNATDLAKVLPDPQIDSSLEADSGVHIRDMHRSNPISRYMPFWNVYAVYEESLDSGASRPLVDLTVANNLDCFHPASIERAVQCDRELALALAAVSPAPVNTDPMRVIIVNLVNTDIYGGSAVQIPQKIQVGNFFNGFDVTSTSGTGEAEKMVSLVLHELNHAAGGLMDEYSTGVTSGSSLPYFSNCQASEKVASSGAQWNDWIQAKQSSPSTFFSTYSSGLSNTLWGVANAPLQICGYTNYKKSNEHCMMHRLNDYHLCPVCRQGATLKLIENAPFLLDWPRAPLRDQVLLVKSLSSSSATSSNSSLAPSSSLNTSSTFVLKLNRGLTAANGFTVTATDMIDGATLPLLPASSSCPVCIELGPSNFAKYESTRLNKEVTIKITIGDSTRNFVLPAKRSDAALNLSKRQLDQETYFRVAVVDSDPAGISGATKHQANLVDLLTTKSKIGASQHDLLPSYTVCLHHDVKYEFASTETEAHKNASLCSLNLTNSRIYQKPTAVAELLASIETWVIIVVCGVGLLEIVLFCYAAASHSQNENGRTRAIFKTDLSTCLTGIRITMTIASILALLCSILSLAAGLYLFYQIDSSLGKILVLVACVLGVLLFLVSFTGFYAIQKRSRKLLAVNAFVLAVPLAIFIFLTVTLNELGTELKISSGFTDALTNDGGGNNNNNNIVTTTTLAAPTTTTALAAATTSSASTCSASPTTTTANTPSPVTTTTTAVPQEQAGYYVQWLQTQWINMVQANPSWVCSLQTFLKCSGFRRSCSGVFSASSECTTGTCDSTNQEYQNPCWHAMKELITQNYRTAFLVLVICSAVLCLAFLLNLVNLVLLWKEKAKIKEETALRIAKIKKEMEKRKQYAAAAAGGGGVAGAAVNNSKTVHNRCLLILRSLEKNERLRLIKEIKRRLVIKGSANFSRPELRQFFSDTLSFTPTAVELEEIFQLGGDLVTVRETAATNNNNNNNNKGKNNANKVAPEQISLRDFLLIFGWEVEEFKSVPNPEKPAETKMGQLARTLSRSVTFRNSKTNLNNNNNNNNNAKTSGSAGSSGGGSKSSVNLNDSAFGPVLEEEMLSASGALSSGTSSPRGGGGGGFKDDDEDDDIFNTTELLKKRHEMRRRSSIALGFDVLAAPPGQSPTTTSLPAHPPLQQQQQFESTAPAQTSNRTKMTQAQVAELVAAKNNNNNNHNNFNNNQQASGGGGGGEVQLASSQNKVKLTRAEAVALQQQRQQQQQQQQAPVPQPLQPQASFSNNSSPTKLKMTRSQLKALHQQQLQQPSAQQQEQPALQRYNSFNPLAQVNQQQQQQQQQQVPPPPVLPRQQQQPYDPDLDDL